MFALEGVALNAHFLTVAHRFQRDRTNANARKVFLASLWYLPCLLMLYMLHSKTWDEEKEKGSIAQYLSDKIHAVRDVGRQMCLHEVSVAKANHGEEACPVVAGTKKSKKVVDDATAAIVEVTVETLEQETADVNTESS
jgi:protoheme IX farnesyltransferase